MTKTTDPPRVLTRSETAHRLGMKPSNVGKFLARRGIKPAFAKAQGYFYWESEIEAIKAEYEADAAKVDADEKRRKAALGERVPEEPREPRVRLGITQRAALEQMVDRPVPVEGFDGMSYHAVRLALSRLERRGLVERLPISPRPYQLTDAGRKVAGGL